jgi:hypothetical protein
MLLMALLLSIKSLRRFTINKPFEFGLILLAVSITLKHGGPIIWDTDYLFNRVPHIKLWIFALGWYVYFSNTVLKRAVIAVVIVLLTYSMVDVSVTSFLLTAGVGLILLYVPHIAVASPLHQVFCVLAGASLFIYVSHQYFIILLHRAGVTNSIPLDISVGLLGGILLWVSWNKLASYLGHQKWFQKLKAAFRSPAC